MTDINDDIFEPDSIDDSETLAKFQDIKQNIELLTDDYLQSLNVETVTDLTQQQYTGLLTYICISYIKPTKCLYKYIYGVAHNNKTTFMYDDNLLYILCEYYIYISQKYNKVCNPFGFASLVGCDVDIFKRWESMKDQRPVAYGLVKRLRKTYETSLENGAQNGKNPVGYIATLNHRFGWSADSKPQLTVNITRNQNEILSSLDSGLVGQISEKP